MEALELGLGVRVLFRDWTSHGVPVRCVGVVNGEPFQHEWEEELTTYVPLHVHKGNRNVIVHEANIIGVKDEGTDDD